MLDRHRNTPEPPRLEAIYVAADASVKAVYHDNTLLVLSADGSSFTHISPAGARTVQLCDFCLSRFASLLTELLDFRNQHVDVPAVSRPLLQQLQRSSQTFKLHFPITYTCWPATAAQAFQQGLVELPDSTRIAVLSKCGYARIMLEYTGLRFAVRYPLLVAYDPASNSYTYAWQLQVFSRSQYPQRWQPALAVACAVADNAANGFKLQDNTQHQQQHTPQLFADLTNQQRQWPQGSPTSAVLRAGSACSSSPVRHYGSPSRAAGSACSSPRRYGSTLQQQHRAWQQQVCDGYDSSKAGWPRAPGAAWSPQCSPTRFQQQQAGQLGAGLAAGDAHAAAAAAAAAAAGTSSSACITQLPISSELMEQLPAFLQSQQQQQQQQQQAARNSAHSSSSSSSQGRIAAGLAQALGHRHSVAAAAAAAAAGPGRGWWMEPSLLLPSDELLQMVWMRDATILFVQDVEEVEVWLHADDSCMYSFQSGGFVTHLLPRAAAAAWDTSATTAAAADDGPGDINSSGRHLLPHMAEHGLSSWHEVRGDLNSRVLEADTAQETAAVAAAAGHVEPLSLQLRQLRLPGGHGHSCSAAAAAHSAGLDHGVSPIGRPQAATAAAAAMALCGTDGLIDGAIDASQMSRVYAASALPEVPVAAVASGCRGGSSSSSSSIAGCGGPALKLPVGQVAARALKFRSTMVRVKRCLASSAGAVQQQDQQAHPQLPWQPQQHSQQQQQCLSTEVLEEQQVPGVGRFTATMDGRVRVRFEDRTILSLAADGASAELVMRDGSRRTVAAANPMGAEEYVQAAVEFAAWAQTSPAQRADALRMQALVAAELRSSARMAAICEWGAGQRLPPQAAAAASAPADVAAAMEAGDDAWAAAACSGQYDSHADAAAAELGYFGSPGPRCGVPAGVIEWDQSQRGSWAGTGSDLGDVQLEQCHASSLRSSMVGGLPPPGGGQGASWQQAVEDMLQANARLLQKLAG